MQVRDHLLFDTEVKVVETPNKGGFVTPEYLIMHYTAGRDADSSIAHFCDPSANASAHLVIGRDGRVCQLVPFNRKAWHAGQSAWAGREGLNGFSIGIELDNAGKLLKVGNQYQAWFGRSYPEDVVLQARHKDEQDTAHWHAFTEQQMSAALEIAKLLARAYTLKDVLGHDDVAPRRKVDPGPAFPMRSFRAHVFGRGEDQAPRYEVTANLLNVRKGPSTEFPTVMPPLPKGTRLSLVTMQANWAKVMLVEGSGGEGWVRNTFIRPVS